MAEGSRITEQGYYRVTESLGQRITQQFAPLYATSSLSATGTQLSIGGINLAAVSTLVGSLSELSASFITASAVSSMGAAATVTSQANHWKNLIATLQSNGTTLAKLGYLIDATSVQQAYGGLNPQVTIIRNVDSASNSSSSVNSIGNLVFDVTSQMVSTLSTDVIPKFTAKAAFNGSAIGSKTFNGYLKFNLSKTLSSTGSFTIFPQLIEAAISLVGGTGSVAAYGGFLAKAQSSLNSNVLMNGSAQMILNAISNNETLTRITEDGRPRIVDTGAFRASVGQGNTAIAELTTTPTVTPFVQGLKGNINGSWGNVTPRVKRGANWVTPKVYVKNNGTWKRVY